MADITTLADFSTVAGQALNTVVSNTIIALPIILAAVLVFVLGWILAILVSKIVEGLLKLVKLEDFLEVHKLEDALGSAKLSHIFVKVVKIYVILVFEG